MNKRWQRHLYFWPWVLGAAAVFLLCWFVQCNVRIVQSVAIARRARRAAIIARADQQHQWVLAGDDRGVHGEHPPAV